MEKWTGYDKGVLETAGPSSGIKIGWVISTRRDIFREGIPQNRSLHAEYMRSAFPRVQINPA